MPKALVTDLDGVIRFFPSERDTKIELACRLPLGELGKTAFKADLLAKVITGKISDEQWRLIIQEELQRAHLFSDAQTAVTQWSEFPGVCDYAILDYLESTFSNIPISLLTNATSRLDADLRALKIGHSFHRIFNSSQIGLAKPSEQLFQIVSSELGLKPQEIIFIDDSKTNVNAAKKIGFLGFEFSGLATLQKDLASLLP